MGWRFLLAHHRAPHRDRCVRIAGLPVCARCLGVYPVLALAFGLQLWLHGRYADLLRGRTWEPYLFAALVTPALLDWTRGRIDPASGTNRTRLLTGVLLGLGLARLLYLHARAPLSPPGLWMLVYLVAGALLGLAYAHAHRDPKPPAVGS